MTEMRVFVVNDGVIKGKYSTCLVCEKKFKLKEKIVLCPIQDPKSGFANVMSIPIHENCYWVED